MVKNSKTTARSKSDHRQCFTSAQRNARLALYKVPLRQVRGKRNVGKPNLRQATEARVELVVAGMQAMDTGLRIKTYPHFPRAVYVDAIGSTLE